MVHPHLGLATEYSASPQLFCSSEDQPCLRPEKPNKHAFQWPEDSSASCDLKDNLEQAESQPRDICLAFIKCLIKIETVSRALSLCQAGTMLQACASGILSYRIVLSLRCEPLCSHSPLMRQSGARTQGTRHRPHGLSFWEAECKARAGSQVLLLTPMH